MQATATRLGLFVFAFLAACAPRSEAQPRAIPLESEDLPWLEQAEQGLGASAIQPMEANTPPVYATLTELARGESWACGDRTFEQCVRAFGSVTLPAGGELRQVHLFGVPTEIMVPEGDDPIGPCSWHLAVKSDRGWLSSIWLGNSPTGCTQPLDRRLDELELRYWFPLALTAAGNGVRVEGQGQGASEQWDPDPGQKATRHLQHVVHLCRVLPRAFACSSAEAEGRVIEGAFMPTLPPGAATPLALAPELLPLSRASEVGRDLAADWTGLPAIGGKPVDHTVAYGFTTSRTLEWPLGDGRLFAIITAAEDMIFVYYERAGVTRRIEAIEAQMSNEVQRLVSAEEVAPGVVHLAVERVNNGPATLAWRTDVVIVAASGAAAKTAGPQVFVLPSGITVAEGTSPASGWRLGVEVDREGVRIRELDGPLAWFRETGRFSWSALTAAIPRWRARLARALRVAGALTQEQRQRHESDRLETTAQVLLLPGYVEPLDIPVAPRTFEVPLAVVP